jgi:TetR/AcrR family transcriptional repressor of nem operon
MPRPSNLPRDEILERAMREFWARGFRSASMDALVREIGTTRFSLYRQFGGKKGLFEAALDHYSGSVVTGVLRPMANVAAGIAGIEKYFDRAISTLERAGRLSDGCLMTNTMTEVGGSDRRIHERTRAHFDRVARMFAGALGCARERGELADPIEIGAWSIALATFAQGIWASARSGVSARELRRAVRAMLRTIRANARAA